MTPDASPSQRLQHELSYLGDSAIRAARDGQLGRLDEAVDVLSLLVETFLEEISRLTGGYSRELADREIHSIGGGWHEMEWVGETYRSLLDAALHTNDRAVLRTAVGLPHRFSRLAITYGDQYVFQEFLRWVPYASYAASQESSDDTRALVLSLEGTYLRETLEWILAPLMDRAHSHDELTSLLDFGLVVLAQFNELLKQAMDQGSSTDYCQFISELSQGVASLERRAHEDEEWPDGDQLAKALGVLKLGQAAWLVHAVESHRMPQEDWNRFRDCLDLPEQIDLLWHTYRSARSEQGWGDLFGWRTWEMNEAPTRTVVGLPTDFRLSLALVIETLLLMEIGQDPPEIDGEEVKYWASDDSDLMIALRRVKEQPLLRRAAGEPPDSAFEDLAGALQAGARRQEEIEANLIVSTPVSMARVQDVASNVRKAWTESARFRALFSREGRIEHVPIREGSPAFGVSNWDLKVLYLDEPPGYWHTENWGSEYGRSLGVGEDERVLEALANVSQPASLPVSTPDEIRQALDQGIETLSSRAAKDLVIGMNGSWLGFLAITESPEFQPAEGAIPNRWTPMLGRYRGRPVVNLLGSNRELLLVFDVKAIEWIQQSPPSERPDTSFQLVLDDSLSFEVWDVPPDRADQLVQEKGFFRRKGSIDLNVDQATTELRTRLFIRVLEWFELGVLNEQHVWTCEAPEV